MFYRLKIRILSELLHRANRESNSNYFYNKSEYFYKIKESILKKYGKHIGYDVQFIEGKKCLSCGGTGIFPHFRGRETCWNCFSGWYKRPVWNILQRVQFGKYIFHIPFQRAYKKPEMECTKIIDGYIHHKPAKYGIECLNILFVLYERGYFQRWRKTAGIHYFYDWRRPYRFINNIIHICRKEKKSIPYIEWRAKRNHKMGFPKYYGPAVPPPIIDELPF